MAFALAGLAALAIAMGIGRFAFTPILPMMQQDAGLSVAGGGWLASANYLGFLLGALAAIGARVRPTAAIRGGLVAIGIVTLAMAFTEDFASWIVLRFLAGLANAWAQVFTFAWCLEKLAAAGRPRLNAVMFAGVGTGIAVAGGVCLVLMGWQASSAQAWLASGAISLAATAAIWPLFGTGGEAPAAAVRPPLAAHGRRWDKGALRLVLCFGASGFGYIIPATFLPAMARQLIPDPSVFGWAWPVFGAAAALAPLAAAGWARHLGNRRLWLSSYLVMACGVALPVFWPAIGGIMIAGLLVGGTFMVNGMAGMQEARALAGPRATALMAAMTAAFATGQIVGPVAVSYVAGSDGRFEEALLAAAFVLVASAGALWQARPGAS